MLPWGALGDTRRARGYDRSVGWVYDFADGSRDMRELLGGKGANVAEMTRVLGPDRVPAGFTITTEACVAYMAADRDFPDGLEEEVHEALGRLEEQAGKRLGDPADPLLVSVRSGARESMPGMLDTVLNLGLNDDSVVGLGDDRFAWDSYRRFVQMFGNVCRGIPGDRNEELIAAAKREAGVKQDVELGVEELKSLAERFKQAFRDETGEEFPQEPREQLRQAVRAVFDSWMGERAVAYRRINRIPDEWGTAVNVQQMVFGNKGDTSGSGVAFSRDEVTGEPEPSGDFLPNAQGEDVVSGVRTPRDISELRDWLPAVHTQLMEILRTLESHYKDMQDTEFTVEEGQLFMLQTRNAKRPAQAAVRFAVDAVSEELLTREEAIATIDPSTLDALLHPTFDPRADFEVLASGVAASPGAAKGEVVFTAADAVAAEQDGRAVILVRPFTEADDVAGFHAAKGILTSEGGKASHAALVARGMGRPAVVGAGELSIDLKAREIRVGDTTVSEGDRIAIDGTKGCVTLEDVPLVEAETSEYFERVLEWSDEVRRLGVRANADTPEDARRARELGAEGVGLCRTEHMFMEGERLQIMREMILSESDDALKEALVKLEPMQREDFEGIFSAMDGLPVTVRLLDPPLHEFLPDSKDLAKEIAEREGRGEDATELRRQLRVAESLEERNPMLGLRGCRLGLLRPEVYLMQARAIAQAAREVREAGGEPVVEIMIPLVGFPSELERMRTLILEELAGEELPIGTMIELPRACAVAGEIARVADFFSFGTNDLTQMVCGISRDDAEEKFLSQY